jgi:hypothetical protein
MPIASLRRPHPDEGFDDGERPPWASSDRRHRAGRKRPSPEARRPVLAAVGVLVVVGCAALGAEVATRVDHRSAYLAVATYVPQGAVIVPRDLATVRTTLATGVAAIPAAEESSAVGRRASEPLEPGGLLVPDDLSDTVPLPQADALVGATLGSNQAPTGLTPGDWVIVVLSGPDAAPATGATDSSGSTSGPGNSATTGSSSPPGGTSSVVGQGELAIGTVYAIAPPSASDQADSPDTEIVTLEIPQSAAAEVTAASAAGDISLAQIARPASS